MMLVIHDIFAIPRGGLMKYFIELSVNYDFLTVGRLYPMYDSDSIIDDVGDELDHMMESIDSTCLVLELS